MKGKTLLIVITIISALGGLLFGYDTGVINGTQYFFSQHFDLSSTMKGWVIGSALLGCLVGALFSGFLSSAIGRKKSLIISAFLFSISAWGSGLPSFLPQSVALLVVFRIIGGLGIGIASMNAPTYIAEISPAKNRGVMVSFYQLAIVTGFFLVFLVTYFIGNGNTEIENLATGWRVMFWTELIPSLAFLTMLFIVPKSPRWLFLKGREAEAIDVLKLIHGEEGAKNELKEIRKHLDEEKSQKGIKINYLKKGVLTVIIIGTMFSILQQFTGINAVLYYGADIFDKALGFGKEDVLAQQVLLALVNFLFTFVAMFTVDKLGRKPLLYIGSFGMIFGFLLLGFSLMNQQVGIVSLVGVLIFIGSFSMSMGPVVWIMLSEMFPNKIRSIAMSVAVAFQWFANYIVSQSFPMVVESEVNNNSFWNGSLPYFVFTAFIIFTVFFVWKFIPETKGKSLEELESLWDIE